MLLLTSDNQHMEVLLRLYVCTMATKDSFRKVKKCFKKKVKKKGVSVALLVDFEFLIPNFQPSISSLVIF